MPMFRGLLEQGQLYQTFDEDVHEGMRLGRNQWLDAASLAYMVENDVQEMGEALGITYQDNEELKVGEKEDSRDKHRWELDPASSDDYQDRVRDKE